MLQHFGNFRVILRVDLAGRSRGENTAASEAITISRSCIFAKPETAQGRFPVSSDENFSDQSFRQGGIAVLLSDPENSDIPHSISDN